jgi:hypothetical protein
MPRSEKVTRQALEAAAKKASARPTELEFLLRPLGKRAAMPEAEYFLALHGQLPELTVESIPRFSEVGLAQVGMFDALGTTWSVNGTEALEIQAPRGCPLESLGHFRLIEDGDTTVIAEAQSNVFQEWAARSAADPDVLKPLAWMREVWEQVWVQVAVKKAVARGTRKIRFPTAETLRAFLEFCVTLWGLPGIASFSRDSHGAAAIQCRPRGKDVAVSREELVPALAYTSDERATPGVLCGEIHARVSARVSTKEDAAEKATRGAITEQWMGLVR